MVTMAHVFAFSNSAFVARCFKSASKALTLPTKLECLSQLSLSSRTWFSSSELLNSAGDDIFLYSCIFEIARRRFYAWYVITKYPLNYIASNVHVRLWYRVRIPYFHCIRELAAFQLHS